VTARRIRRLTVPEIDATLAALKIDSTHAALGALPPDPEVRNFANNSDNLEIVGLWANQYDPLVETLATAAAGKPEVVGCDPSTGEDACAKQFIASFVGRAWRRPLTADEQTRLEALFATGKMGGTFTDGVELVIEAALHSPEFLYHYEIGDDSAKGETALAPYELAEEIAYLATGAPPDDALLKLAADNSLAKPDVRESEVRRLVKNGGRAQLSRFVFSWLGLERIDTNPKKAATYPALTADIRAKMRAETEAFVASVLVDGDGTLAELLTADYTMADSTLAQYYGINAASAQPGVFARVNLDASTKRAGILTQGSLLAGYSQEDNSGPVRRGHLVRSQLLCQDMPPPPANVKIVPPKNNPTHTTRQLYEQHSASDFCWSCHQMMDPIGFGFENFDGAGIFRTTENGFPIDSSGVIAKATGDANTTFNGPADLGAKLAESATVRDCLATNLFRFTMGREETDGDSCALSKVSAAYAKDTRVVDILVNYVRSDEFVNRIVEQAQ
jgi:hypothetical protein